MTQLASLRNAAFAFLLAASALWPPNGGAEDGLVKITAGTLVQGERVAGWSDVVLVATPRIGSGDTEGLSPLVKEHAELLVFVIAARVQRPDPADGDRANSGATLRQIGVGLAARVDGSLRVVSGPPPTGPTASPPPKLGLLAGQVLRTAERSLDEMRIVVRRTTMILYDSPAVVRIGERNENCTVRSLLWVEPEGGRLHHALWVLRRGGDRWRLALEQGVYLPVPYEEDRLLHVQGDQFTFGIPSPTAIGLATLPPGHRFAFDPALAELACLQEYDEATLGKFTTALVAAMRRGD